MQGFFGVNPYSKNLGLDLDVTVAGPLTASAGFGLTSREMVIVAASSGVTLGELSDQQLYGRVGLGVAF
jgi:hypothetical protein